VKRQPAPIFLPRCRPATFRLSRESASFVGAGIASRPRLGRRFTRHTHSQAAGRIVDKLGDFDGGSPGEARMILWRDRPNDRIAPYFPGASRGLQGIANWGYGSGAVHRARDIASHLPHISCKSGRNSVFRTSSPLGVAGHGWAATGVSRGAGAARSVSRFGFLTPPFRFL
jgi:hypothetical protein